MILEKQAYTIKEVAKIFGLSYSYVFKEVTSGGIPSIYIGSKRLIPKSYVDKVLAGEVR